MEVHDLVVLATGTHGAVPQSLGGGPVAERITVAPEPFDIPEHVADAVKSLTTRLVANRRGSTVWDVETPAGRLAVKLGYRCPPHDWTALAPARESVILRQVIPEDVQCGEWAEGTWSAQPWREGVDLFSRWERHRARRSVPSLAEARSCAAALSALHAKGWAHGDVQPNHLLMDTACTWLIDLGLASGGGHVSGAYDFPYRGCLVHYEAPEISCGVLESGTAAPTRESDVYALGASLFISATGWRHVDYPDNAPREVQRRAIVGKPHRPVGIPGPLGSLITAMMRRDPAARPTAAQVAGSLTDSLADSLNEAAYPRP
ncbi:protein kinase [Streptomyces sp. NPDC050610]|uniref:protein kinase domain-containing protein n=1 Tax=Streptomyces sp. NPDC050610 TaxID=3157097 RepID=UPI003433D2EA